MTLATALLTWYDQYRRVLPWREDPTPYHVWLSEIMLQQTRVEAVREYYTRFCSVLPTIEDLARAEEDVYLKLWEGLGYYSRVRNLHKAAVQIMTEHDGQMPRSSAQLQKLAGIGPYTAAAIASICFGERAPAIDGNLLRVFARFTGYREDIKSARAKADAAAFYLEIFPEDRPGDCNQALMDLGATVCLPSGRPLCARCPWQISCIAQAGGLQQVLPVMPPKKQRAIEQKTVFLIYAEGRIMLRRRPETGLLAGLYEFPNAPGKLSRKEAEVYLQGLGITAVQIKPLPAAKHIFTHKEWHMTGYEVLAEGLPEGRTGEDTGEDRAGIFPVGYSALDEVYSVPSAFAKYQAQIRREYLQENTIVE